MKVKRTIAGILSVVMSVCVLSTNVWAASDTKTAKTSASASSVSTLKTEKDDIVKKNHSVVINGKTIKYTSQSGLMYLNTDLGEYEIGFTALTKKGVTDMKSRPITFAFNGGPGGSTMWLNIGALGPKVVDLNADGSVKSNEGKLKTNPYSILDLTDIVFIDPVGTGYSRPVGDTSAETFYGYENDAISVGDFIMQYITRTGRWDSPKYLAGESYGTTRAVKVADYLSGSRYINVDGLMLVSCANDFTNILNTPSNDMYYINYLPTMAAIAWYHKKVDAAYQKMTLEAFLDEIREFTASEYQLALYKGRSLTTKDKNAVIKKLSGYLGLSEETIKANNLRVTYDTFRSELLSDKNLTVGRFDGRVTGATTDVAGNDPSFNMLMQSFNSAMLNYYANEVGFVTDRPYLSLNNYVTVVWDYGLQNSILAQEDTIKSLLSSNPKLKIWTLNGYYDLATPFAGTEWVFNHVFINDELKNNIRFTYYESGHMFYTISDSLKQFRKDAEEWYGAKK